MIWKKELDLSKINFACKNTLSSQLGMEFIAFTDTSLTARMPVDARTHQPAGILHGGASVALAETIGSVASLLCLESPSAQPVGLEINANHLKSVRSGFVIGTATPIRIGSRVHVWKIDICNEVKDLVCTCRLTVLVS